MASSTCTASASASFSMASASASTASSAATSASTLASSASRLAFAASRLARLASSAAFLAARAFLTEHLKDALGNLLGLDVDQDTGLTDQLWALQDESFRMYSYTNPQTTLFPALNGDQQADDTHYLASANADATGL